MKHEKRTKKAIIILISGLVAAGWFFVLPVAGEDYEDMTEEERQEELEKLDEKAEKYEEIIDLKQKQLNLLSGQITSLAGQINSLEQQIREKEEEIDLISRELEETIAAIAEKERLIDRQKEVLAELIREYHAGMEDDASLFLAGESGMSELLMKREDWVIETGDRIRTLLREIENTKAALEMEQIELEKQKTEVEELKQELGEKNKQLETLKAEKQSQYSRTQTEEQKYQDKLARVEAQKNELFNFSAAANFSEIFGSIGDYDTPDKKYHASTSWYYSQRDPRWGSKTIGRSGSTMKEYGCAVSSVAMVFSKHGSRIDPGNLAKKPIFEYALIKWPSSWSGGIKLVSSTSPKNVSWSTIDRELKDGNPVIVHIVRALDNEGHFVVIHGKTKKGKYVVHDPFFGPNHYLDTSRSLVGKLGTNSSTWIRKMIIYND